MRKCPGRAAADRLDMDDHKYDLDYSHVPRLVDFSWALFGSILSSQDDPPTLENHDFVSTGARFLKNRRLRSEDGLEIVLGLYWASFGCSSGSLGGLLGSSGVLLGVSCGSLGGFSGRNP